MVKQVRSVSVVRSGLAVVMSLCVVSCGSTSGKGQGSGGGSGKGDGSGAGTAKKAAAPVSTAVVVASTTAPAAAAAGQKGNACPVEGCLIEVTEAERTGDELSLTFTANFDPDVSRNHIHVYWDRFTSKQVSNNAETVGVTKGQWVPTKVTNGFLTQGAVSLLQREGSTKVCVTAGDRNHDVIDAAKFTCRDVGAIVA